MFLNLQIRYVVDSWVEFVTCRKALTSLESKETGHYICYKYVNGILLHFDDALVNRVDLLYQLYCTPRASPLRHCTSFSVASSSTGNDFLGVFCFPGRGVA